MSRTRSSASVLLLVIAGQWTLTADEALAPGRGGDDVNFRGIFDSPLPGTENRHSLKMTFHPHFGDFHRHDSLRVPIGFKYGLNDRWELSSAVETFVDHGFGDRNWGDDAGLSGFEISSKYRKRFFENYDWDQVVGIEYSTPTGEVPEELTDGFAHFRPFINFARRFERDRSAQYFWGLGLDLVSKTSYRGTNRKNALEDDAQVFTFGAVWERERFNYTLETSFATTRLIGDNARDLIVIKPGFIWKVPRSHTFNSRGNWLLGLGLKAIHGHDGFDIGLSVKVKISLKFDR